MRKFPKNILSKTPKRKISIHQKSSPPKRNTKRLSAALVMRLYDYTCAACHYRIVTLSGESAVDAAHIFPFSQSRDDSIGNGISLCKLHHWSFDRGLFAIEDDYKIRRRFIVFRKRQ
ncbi:MAG: HNH endonuclease [Aridibacter sp.]